MASSNKTRGNEFEKRFSRMMSVQGWWVHLFRQSDSGQPCDLIAVKNRRAVIVDCKVCDNGTFQMSRIEDNQLNAMELWYSRRNGVGWFALELPDKTVWMFPLDALTSYEKKSMSEPEIRANGVEFTAWVRGVE